MQHKFAVKNVSIHQKFVVENVYQQQKFVVFFAKLRYTIFEVLDRGCGYVPNRY